MNTFFAPRFRLPWFLIIIAAINAFGWLLLRWGYENSLRTTQLTVDYDETRIFADAYKVPHAKLLGDLKNAGVSSVGVYNLSLSNLRDNGRLAVLTREEGERLYPTVAWQRYVPAYRTVIAAVPQNRVLLQQVYDHLVPQAQPSLPPRLLLSTPGSSEDDEADAGATHDLILVPFSKQLINDAQIGFDPAQVKAVQTAGLTVTARISNALNLDLVRLRAMLDDVQKTGARVVIFAEDEVVGYDTMIKATALELRRRNLLFGNIEFTKQRGWQDFAKQTEGRLVRVHSVGGDEAAKVKSEVLIERFSRAVKERNIRVAYIRLARQFKGEYEVAAAGESGTTPQTPTQIKTALDQNLHFIGQVSEKLRAQPLPFAWLRPGLEMGTATPFGNYPLGYLSPRVGGDGNAKLLITIGAFLTGLGAVGAVLLMLNLFFDLTWQTKMWWTLLGLAIVAVLCRSPGMGAKLIALVIGCLTPVIGILWGGLPRLWYVGQDDLLDARFARRPPLGQTIWIGIGALIKTSLLVMMGGMLVMAIMNNWTYFSKADEFLGEKATQLLPLILISLAFAGEIFPGRVIEGGANRAHRRLVNNVNNALNHPITARMVAISLILLVAGYVWIARTGNESGMEISGFELKMRAMLEQIFITRPRTKEVFLGNPAFIFAVWFMLRRQWLPAFAAIVAVTIGQSDLLNTFCHLHTPTFYSLLRSIHAVWIGAIVGAIALWLYTKITHPRIFTPSNLGSASTTPFDKDADRDDPEEKPVERAEMREWKG